MRVLITGGTGLVGTPVSEKFVRNGWDVRVIAIEPDCAIDGVQYTQCDILDFDALAPLVAGCDAIVHLAAIPSTRLRPNATLFNINVSGAYNVFEAAERAGVKRIAQASSINALGGYWGCDDRQLDYFPLDEDHPVHTTDAYSYSKELVENIADYYWRRSGISSVSFRLPAVWNDAVIEQRSLRESRAQRRRQVAAFRDLPRSQRSDLLAAARAKAQDLRARRLQEYDAVQRGEYQRLAPTDDWLFDVCYYERYNYWNFIHTDDSTQAFELAITADFAGAHPLFVNSDLNALNYESEALLALFYPEVTRRTLRLEGAESLVSIARARQLIGFEPTVRKIL